MNYDYAAAVYQDVEEWILEYAKREGLELKDIDCELSEADLYDDLFIEDSVTGNASGSYTMNRYQAEENLVGNFDLLKKANDAFGTKMNIEDAESADVLIRCYLLHDIIQEVLVDLGK